MKTLLHGNFVKQCQFLKMFNILMAVVLLAIIVVDCSAALYWDHTRQTYLKHPAEISPGIRDIDYFGCFEGRRRLNFVYKLNLVFFGHIFSQFYFSNRVLKDPTFSRQSFAEHGQRTMQRNKDLHRDLRIPYVFNEIKKFVAKHGSRLEQHVNAEVVQLVDNCDLVRRLKKTKPFELV